LGLEEQEEDKTRPDVPPMQITDWREFNKALAALGLVSRDEGGNSDCFYRCLKKQALSNKTVQAIRNEIADWILQNPPNSDHIMHILEVAREHQADIFDNPPATDSDAVMTYVNAVKGRLYAGDIEIGAACALYSLRVTIHCTSEKGTGLLTQIHGQGAQHVHLCYFSCHYRSAVQRSSSPPIELVIHYRGYHFYKNLYTDVQRAAFVNSTQVNQNMYSMELHEASMAENGKPSTITTDDNSKTVESDEADNLVELLKSKAAVSDEESVEQKALKLRRALVILDEINGQYPTTTAEGAVVSTTPLKNMLQKYIHSMGGFVRGLTNPRAAGILPLMMPFYLGLGIKKNPFVSTSSTLDYALRYGSGYFLIGTEDTQSVLLPEYSMDPTNTALVAKNPVLGKVFVIVHTSEEFCNSSAISTFHLIRRDELRIACRKDAENETIFPGYIEGTHVCLEFPITVPRVLEKKKKNRSDQYDQLKDMYGEMQYGHWFTKIESALSLGKSAEEERALVDRIYGPKSKGFQHDLIRDMILQYVNDVHGNILSVNEMCDRLDTERL
jgi:hypothetical protein